MINAELEKYIRASLASGMTPDEIKTALLANGWPRTEVEEAMAQKSSGQTLEPIAAAPILPEKKMRPRILLAVLIAVGVLLVGGISWAGYAYYSTLPQKNFQKMVDAMMALKSFEYTAETQTEMNGLAWPAEDFNLNDGEEKPDAKTQPIKYSSKISGGVNFSDLSRPQFSSLFEIFAQEQFKGALGLEIRFVEKTLFLRLSQIPELNLGMIDLSSLKNQWIGVNLTQIQDQINSFSSSAEFKSSFSAEKIQKLKDSLKKSSIFKVTNKFPDETIEGVKTRHYGFALDKEALINFSIEAAALLSDKTPSESEITELREGLKDFEISNNEVWIGKEDSLLYKLAVNSEVKANEKTKVSAKSSSVLTMKNHNQPVKVEAPESFKLFEEWLAEILNSSLVPSSSPIIIE
ncbi:MAG: hypothetical protein AAB871_02055 [Patescibacteria group bacterium]